MGWVLNPVFKAYVQWHLATRTVRIRTHEQARRESFKWRSLKTKPKPEELERIRPIRRRAGTRTGLPRVTPAYRKRQISKIAKRVRHDRDEEFRAEGYPVEDTSSDEVIDEDVAVYAPYSLKELLQIEKNLDVRSGVLDEIIDLANLHIYLNECDQSFPSRKIRRKELLRLQKQMERLQKQMEKTGFAIDGISCFEQSKYLLSKMVPSEPPEPKKGGADQDLGFDYFIRGLIKLWRTQKGKSRGYIAFIEACLYPLPTKKAKDYYRFPYRLRKKISRIIKEQQL